MLETLLILTASGFSCWPSTDFYPHFCSSVKPSVYEASGEHQVAAGEIQDDRG